MFFFYLLPLSDFRDEVQKELHRDADYPCEVVGSWNTWYGEQDQAGEMKKYFAFSIAGTKLWNSLRLVLSCGLYS